jgi:hypothetical protein
MNKTHSRAAFRTITVHLGRSNLPFYFQISKIFRKIIPLYNRKNDLEIVV